MYRLTADAPMTKRIVFLGKALREVFQAMLAEQGCTMPTWQVLDSAQRSPGLSQVHLAAQIGIEGPTLARHLDRLCAEGLVERQRDVQDRRIVRIALTPSGHERWAELKHLADDMDDRLLRCLSAQQQATLDIVIDSIHRALEDTNVPINSAG